LGELIPESSDFRNPDSRTSFIAISFGIGEKYGIKYGGNTLVQKSISTHF